MMLRDGGHSATRGTATVEPDRRGATHDGSITCLPGTAAVVFRRTRSPSHRTDRLDLAHPGGGPTAAPRQHDATGSGPVRQRRPTRFNSDIMHSDEATNYHAGARNGGAKSPCRSGAVFECRTEKSLEIYSRLSIGEAQEEYNRVIDRFPI